MALTKIPGHLLDTTGHIDFADNEQLRFGNSNDVLFYHNPSNNNFQITNNNTAGGIVIQNNASAGGIALQPVINENAVYCAPNGAVQVYHNGSSKLQTTSSGINVTGSVVADGVSIDDDQFLALGSSDEFKLYHTSSGNSIISETGGGSLYLDGSNIYLRNGTATGEAMADFVSDGAVTLYHNNVAKLSTDAAGVNVIGGLDVGNVTSTGHVTLNQDNGTIYLGAGSDLRLFHDGNNSFINNTTATAGALSIKSHDINLMSTGSENMAVFEQDGPVRLYYDNAQKLMTDSGGVNVTGDLAVSGNLNITGDINSTSVTNLDVTDKTITVANNAGSSSAADGAGLIVDTGGTVPSLLWDHSNSAFQFSKAVRVVNTVRIVGGDTSGSSYALIVKNSANTNTLLVRNDGVVQLDANYLYVNHNGGIYSNGAIRARGGLTNDQGDLTLNDTVQVAGPMVIQGSGSQERYLAFTLDGKSSAFSGSNNCFIFNGQGATGDYLAGALYFQSRSATAGREIGFITGTTPAKRMVITAGGNVGIGETNPSAPLEVLGADSGIKITSAISDRPHLSLINGTAEMLRLSANQTYAAVGDSTDGQRYMVFKAGNVGIGTDSPGATLHTVAKSGTTGLLVSGAAGNNVVHFAPSSGTPAFIVNPDGKTVLRRSGSAGTVQNFEFGASNVGGIQVNTGGLGIGGGTRENDIFISTGGNIGFGTDSPQRAFDSRHSLNIFGSGGYTELMLRGRHGSASSLGAFHWSIRGDVGGNNDDLMLLRFTSNSSTYSGTVMHIKNSDGFVGIGPNFNSPARLFHVSAGTSGGTTVRFGQQFDTNVEIGPVTATASGFTSYLNAAGTSFWALGYRDGGSGTGGSFRLRRGATLDSAGPSTNWGDDGTMTIATTTQSETGIAQLALTNNVNANPSHVNIKFNTYAWLGMLQVEQRAAGQYGAMNFWTAFNANPRQVMCLNHQGDLALSNATNQDGVHANHRKVEVTGTTTLTSNSWSVSPGNNGGYDVGNNGSSEYGHHGSYTGAGYFNRHVMKLCLVGNYAANTWYPIATFNQIYEWVSNGSPGANPWDGYAMYFRLYTYDVSAGGGEYLSNRISDRVWINGYTCNSNQRHHIALGAATGHAPNAGHTTDHQDYYNNPYQLCINHHFNSDSYYPSRQTLEIKFKTARSNLNATHNSNTVYVYGYVG